MNATFLIMGETSPPGSGSSAAPAVLSRNLRGACRVRGANLPAQPVRGSAPGRFLKSPAAFTLIEVLVAVVVLSVGIVLVLGAMNTAILAADRARDSAFASFLGRQVLEASELKLRGGAEAAGVSGSETFISPWGGPDWSVETEAEDFPPAGASGSATGRLVRVSVVLRRNGSAQSYPHGTFAVAR